ncbi:MAG: phosphate/phosphite/phosphonate ABC transporter substrate-binding protein [Gammaproteobacteria bacterium]|nr:phosphate/phosphite/phosphonate ABC transporter substrate-binding protein [Gammaproteobacteria bacterium]
MPGNCKKHIVRPYLFLALFSGLVLSCSSFAQDHIHTSKTFTLGVHPYLPESELHRRFQGLINYLSEKLDEPVGLKVSKDYESHIEHTGNNAFDIAFMGPSSYITLTERYGKRPLLARLEVNNDPHFRGVIVVHKDSGITSLKQLAGKRFAFGSAHSTMSYIVPRYMLMQAGVRLGSLETYRFLGNHRNVALGVLTGEFDAGAVKEEIYEDFMRRGLVELARTPAISEHVFVARNGITETKIDKIRKILLWLSGSENGKKILSEIKSGVTGLVNTSNRDYDNLRQMMHVLPERK